MQNFYQAKGVNPMHTLRFGIAVAAAMFVLPVNAQVEIGPGGVRIGRGECEQLRRACENKEALGSKAKVTAAVTVRGVETLMTTTRTSAKEAG